MGARACGHAGESEMRKDDKGAVPSSKTKQPIKRPWRKRALVAFGVLLFASGSGLFIHTEWEYSVQNAANERLAGFASPASPNAEAGDGARSIDWTGLRAVNPDAVAWLSIPGTNVDFPVFQGETNDTYLHTTATGEPSVGGQVFLDFESAAPGLVDEQSLVYGHHLNNGTMFAQVDAMGDQAFFDEHDTVQYQTDRTFYELTPLFFYRTPATDADARRMSFPNQDAFHTYLRGLLAKSSAQRAGAEAAIPHVTKVLTLATCDYDNDFGPNNGRGLLVCALKSEVDV